jgi:hypothetical protein
MDEVETLLVLGNHFKNLGYLCIYKSKNEGDSQHSVTVYAPSIFPTVVMVFERLDDTIFLEIRHVTIEATDKRYMDHDIKEYDIKNPESIDSMVDELRRNIHRPLPKILHPIIWPFKILTKISLSTLFLLDNLINNRKLSTHWDGDEWRWI